MRKRRVNLCIDEGLYSTAKTHHINFSEVLDSAIRNVLGASAPPKYVQTYIPEGAHTTQSPQPPQPAVNVEEIARQVAEILKPQLSAIVPVVDVKPRSRWKFWR